MKIIRKIQQASWPSKEAARLVKRLETAKKDHAVLATGYGPSGKPHIGTFGEVIRTAMLRHTFNYMTGAKSQLLAFSDDMDGMRRVPSNLPNQELLARYLAQPLTSVPDPYGEYASFADRNNHALMDFLNQYNFDYTFMSATKMYRDGLMDEVLMKILAKYDEVMAAIMPSIGEERQTTYSPFLPVCPRTGRVLQVPVVETDLKRGRIIYDENGTREEVPVTGGHCKLQWKVDWAARWIAFGVDYEMHGKDLIDSATVSSRICKILGGKPPLKLVYELFLDEEGQKISKSKGNGITMEEWLEYGPKESLALYMYQSPTKAKKLGYNIVAKANDEYISHLNSYQTETNSERLINPVWYLHEGNPPQGEIPVSFSMLLNLAGVCKDPSEEALWYIVSHQLGKTVAEQQVPFTKELIRHAVAYFRRFKAPLRQQRLPDAKELRAIQELLQYLYKCPEDVSGEELQTKLYALGKEHDFVPLRSWFQALYEIFIGQQDGPRFGNFMAIYGLAKTIKMIEEVVDQATHNGKPS